MADIQQQLDEQSEARTQATTTEVTTKPLLTDAAIQNDRRKTDIVEVNFSNQTARVVESSDAPKLTFDVAKEKSEPIQDAELIFDSKTWTVKVRMGVPFSLTAKHAKVLAKHENTDTADTLSSLYRDVKNLYLANMIASPAFSYGGQGEGQPIEQTSDILIEALWSAYASLNAPIADDIFQVSVLRGQPIHAGILLSESFELYPQVLGKSAKDMTEAEVEQTENRSLAQRQILVSSMVFPEAFTFSLNCEASGEGVQYPIEDVSEQFLATLYQAYRVSNIPEVGLQAIQRFQSV